jgi:DNA (cytosine-5)-methyltransferase 1
LTVFWYSLVWSEENADFLDLPSMNELQELSLTTTSTPCVSCALKSKEEQLEKLCVIPGGYTQYGIKYHQNDFIYIQPHNNSSVLEIAQILKVNSDDFSTSVQLFGRYDDYLAEKKNCGSSASISDEVRCFLRE